MITGSAEEIGMKSNSIKKKPIRKWAGSSKSKFITLWQAFFNRRILSFSCFALQVGDLFMLILPPLFVLYACLTQKDAESSANAPQILMALAVIFGCRNGLLSYIFGLSLERAVLWHQYLTWNALISSCHHWNVSESEGSGLFLEIVLIAFIVFSIKPIRRYFWDIFMMIHWILIALMLFACIAHEVGLPVAALGYFAIDVIYRIYNVYKYRKSSSQVKLERIGSNIVKITMQKGQFEFDGGQYFFLMIPALSSFQWHPFSTSSGANEDEILLYVKTLGDWTTLLYKLAGENGSPVSVNAYVDGPYGLHSIAISDEKYQNFLCFSGGIGVIPIISTVKDILYEHKEGRPVSNLHFIWTGREKEIINKIIDQQQLIDLLPSSDSQVLKSYYHLSTGGTPAAASNEQDIETQVPLKQQLKLEKGRPNIEKYFEMSHQAAVLSKQKLVAVIACGPQALIDSVEMTAQTWSKDGIRFDVHQEVFIF